MASLRKNASDDEADLDGSGTEPDFSDIEEEPVLEAAAKLSIAEEDAENSKGPSDPPEATAETDAPNTSAESKEQDGETSAPPPDASPEVPLAKTDDTLDAQSVADADGPDQQTPTDASENAAADEPPAEEKEKDAPAQADDESESESTSSAADSGADSAADDEDDSKPDDEKPAKIFEPYEVPSFGHHFFCHDDRYMQSNRGRGRGRGGSQLWEKKEPQWEHDGFLELTKGDTAPPRMVQENGGRCRRSDSRDTRSEAGRGRRRGGGRRIDGRHAPEHESNNNTYSDRVVGSSNAPEAPAEFPPLHEGGPVDGSGRSYAGAAGAGFASENSVQPARVSVRGARGPAQGMRGFEAPAGHGDAVGHILGMVPVQSTVETTSAHTGFHPASEQRMAPAPATRHIVPANQHMVQQMVPGPPLQHSVGGGATSHAYDQAVDGAASMPHSEASDGMYQPERHSRGGGQGRGPAQRPSRPTFYGRAVSAAQKAANEHMMQRSERQTPAAVGSGDAPGGSRRYLAGRVDPAHAGGPVYTMQGQNTAAENVQVAMPTMVPVQRGIHQQAHGMHLNPNAPGFLPVGDQPHPQHNAGVNYNAQRMQGQAGPQMVPSQTQQQEQQAPQMQQYLSASTAKGMMLRNELQSMMAMPQASASVPPNAQGYVQQVYYGPGAVVSPEGDAPGCMTANTMYTQAPNYPNAQHISVSPVGVQPHQSPEMMVQMPYAQYVVDGHHMQAPMQSRQGAPPAHPVVSHPA